MKSKDKALKQENIEQRLRDSIFKISLMIAVAALLGVIALIVMSNRYSSALKNYGFAQGDIGRAMFKFAETRSALRAAIGYDDQAAIDKTVAQHAEGKEEFTEALEQVEKTIVSKSGRETYDKILAEVDTYWELDAQVMDLGATTDRQRCVQAQNIAMNELSTSYHTIYDSLEELLEVKVKQGDSLSKTLSIVAWILAVVILVIIVAAMVTSTKVGKNIARKISVPLGELGTRLKSFAAGDLVSPFPMVETGDEVERMEKDVREMADNIDTIIFDIGEILGKMAAGDYTVKSDIADRYTGDFQKLYESMRGLRDQMTETLLSIGDASNQVFAGSEELANAAQCLAEGATDQAHEVAELHTTISNITVAMEESAQSAEDSYLKSQEYADKAEKSREEMATMMSAMQRISDASMKIGDIISEIESIAAQTNLLSLNASIEAARAGESGRGFAVVADQIRDLADQSAKAVVDTRELIEASVQEVSVGNSVAEHASEAIETVVEGIKQIADSSKNLKVLMGEQAEAMRQAEIGIDQISGVVQSNAATAEEASATSEELSAQANMLDQLVGQFELSR